MASSSSSSTPTPPPGSWIPRFLSRYPDPAPPLPPRRSTLSDASAVALAAPRDANAPAPNSIYTSRGRKQASVFLAGVVSVVWAGSMTRRSLRKRKIPLPAAVLQEVAPVTTIGPAAQASRQAGQQAAALAPAAAPAAVPMPGKVASGGLQEAAKTSIMAETLQAYRGGVRQTSPGVSIGASEVVAKPAGETLVHTTSPVGAAGATSAEDAAAAQAAAELNASGPILAMEALFLATANVLAWALLVTGGALWYADISSVEELRRAVRGGLGVDGTGRSEQEAEEEMEEWLARVLKRGDERSGSQSVDERGRVR